jgi:Protein kinase domain
MSGIACGAGMSMNMNMAGTPSGSDSPDENTVPNNQVGVNEVRRTGSCDGSAPNTLQGITDAAAAQQQAQNFHKTIGATRTGSTETNTSSNASITESTSNGSMRSNQNPADMIHKPPRGQPQYSHPGIPASRSNGSTANSMYKPGKHNMGTTGSQDFDHDHQTFATATTASATISYSTDEVDHVNSDVSEAGMEVVMDSDNNSSGDEQVRDEHILSLLDPHSSKQSRIAKPKEEPYKSHSFPAGKHTFTVDTRYSFIRVIGSGAYGVVVSAKDSKAETDVAIKMVPRAFHDEIDAKRILREIKLLKHFRHENIVGIIDMMPPSVEYVEDFNDVYMVTDLMETDLHRIIYSKQKLSMDHVQYFVYQVLRGLKYIHSCNVLHRDLKPSNLLVNSNCDLKICDFGLARGIYDDSNSMDESTTQQGSLLLTEYVVTRWYRAPEIMLACHQYSKPIDVWSVGCIFAELILRKPYFPGDDYIDQVCNH